MDHRPLPSAISHQPLTGERGLTRERLTGERVKEHARELGFDACGIAPAAAHPEPAFFRQWLERVYAQYAGLGWIGKNTCVIHPQLGSWIFLAEIICSLPLELDAPSLDQCGTCTLCLEACPTHALAAPGVLDSTRCISYLTIEHRGDIPREFVAGIGTHVYGCDICQEVCPWNHTAPISADVAWQPRAAWDMQTV